MLYYAVSLGNQQSTFRDTLLISYSSVDIVKNISLQEHVIEIMFRNVDIKLPGDTASHLSSGILNEVELGCFKARITQKELKDRTLKEYLGRNVIVWCSCERASLV